MGILLFSHDVAAQPICFELQTSKKIVVELQTGRTTQEAFELLQQSNAELEKQIMLYKEILAQKDEQIQATDKALESCQEGLQKMKQVKQPSLLQSIIGNLGFVGIGVLIALLL